MLFPELRDRERERPERDRAARPEAREADTRALHRVVRNGSARAGHRQLARVASDEALAGGRVLQVERGELEARDTAPILCREAAVQLGEDGRQKEARRAREAASDHHETVDERQRGRDRVARDLSERPERLARCGGIPGRALLRDREDLLRLRRLLG